MTSHHGVPLNDPMSVKGIEWIVSIRLTNSDTGDSVVLAEDAMGVANDSKSENSTSVGAVIALTGGGATISGKVE
ncbi:hypothetical protein BSLG_007280 [Batrachochytrium salamandrivorans]|nr:hypothetical protein BSLG_007280 [Batrachochytrium salamandrivorans]